MSVTFNGITRQIEVTDSSVFELEAGRELYSEWKRWQQLDTKNAGFAPAFRTFGGDPTAQGQNAPKYYFLINYWRVYINNGNVVSVALNLYSDDFTNPYLVAPGSGVSDRNSDAVNINNETIEYSSYNGGVTLDMTNSSGSAVAGIAFPIGTPRQPVNNTSDAVTIANTRGFKHIFVLGDAVFDTGDSLDHFTIEGENAENSLITVNTGANTFSTRFIRSTLTGILDGSNTVTDCEIDFLDFSDGNIVDCQINQTITLTGSSQLSAIGCSSGVVGAGTPTIDMGGSGSALILRDYNGGIQLINKTGPENVSIDLSSGQIKLDSTITNGNIICRGVGKLLNNSNGAVVTEEILDSRNLNKPLFTNGFVYVDSTSLESGITFPIGTNGRPVNNLQDALTIAQNNGLTGLALTGFFNASVTHNLDGITVIAGSGSSNVLILSGASTNSASFERLIITGTFNGLARIRDCVLGTTGLGGVTELEGRIVNCIINNSAGIIQKNTGAGTLFDNCSFIAPDDPQITLDANGKGFGLRDCTGNILITNKTDSEADQIHIIGARVEIDPSCTAGTLTIDGNGVLTDNSGGTTIVNNLSNSTNILPQLNIINEGVQKSSILIPHTTDL